MLLIPKVRFMFVRVRPIRYKMIALIAAALIGALCILPAVAQGGPSDDLLKQIAQFLGQQLGKPVAKLENYTFQAATYPDSSLGCPQAGKTYTQGAVQAYKFLVTLKGITYDIRTTANGSPMLLCSNADIKQAGTLGTYRSPQFTISYPDTWTFNKRDTDVYFGLGPAPVCAEPGMTVVAFERQITTQTPDSLLDEYIQITPNGKFDTDRTSIGNIGRSVLYTAACTDGTMRQARATTFIAYARGYRIVQFAPQTAYNQWSGVFLQILNGFSPATIGSGGGNGQAVVPITKPPLALLAHIFAGNLYIGTLADLPGLPLTTDAVSEHAYRDPVVSPDGKWIAFVATDQATLYVTSTKGGPVLKLAAGLKFTYPPAWSPNSAEIAYLTQSDGSNETIDSIIAVKVDGSGTRKIGDTQPIGASTCAGGPFEPAELLYLSNTGDNGNRLLLTWARDGMIYYSRDCSGIGVAQISDGGANSQVVNTDLRRAQLSPDGTELLGVLKGDTAENLVRVKISDQSITVLKTAVPDQVAWSTDGKAIYYSTNTAKNKITLDNAADKDRGTKVFGFWPVDITVYEVALHRLDLNDNQDVVIFKTDGRAIGRILPGPDGTGVLFTFIQSSARLAEAFKNNVSEIELRRQRPNIQLYWRAFAQANVELLAISEDPAWGPLGSAVAPTPTGGNPPTPLATLKPTQTLTRSAPPTNTRQPTRQPTSIIGG